ncbi:hypothetical protein DVL57_20310 [Salmonella enterica]|nr:hypothetical protein [Salmonella enterica subsp. enterica serovar Altona]EAA7160709.1 hypothetical protein [Salmonella enterica]EBV5853779.1 hypothetical protein [Salmonella enterica subsp. enterica serovar Saintpaul]EBV7177410.1 hypothetical protein [Salmonella enterica subsp. enterica serovar Thompson]ECU8934409.1 hypothetical protein [Salmonella enterica subsp. enterica]
MARHSARAPAIFRPCVVVAERYFGILYLLPIFSLHTSRHRCVGCLTHPVTYYSKLLGIRCVAAFL